jgi:hypothetical protein
MRGGVTDFAGDDVAEQPPGFAVEAHQLHLLEKSSGPVLTLMPGSNIFGA